MTCNVFFALEQALELFAGFPLCLDLGTASWNARSKEDDCVAMASELQSGLVTGRRLILRILDVK